MPDNFTSKAILRSLAPYGKSVVKYLHVSCAVSESASENITKAAGAPVRIIPNAIKLEQFTPKAPRVRPEGSYEVLYVGRLEKRKLS